MPWLKDKKRKVRLGIEFLKRKRITGKN